MACSQRLPGIAMVLGEFGAAFNIGEEEGDSSGGKVRIHTKHSKGYCFRFRVVSKAFELLTTGRDAASMLGMISVVIISPFHLLYYN